MTRRSSFTQHEHTQLYIWLRTRQGIPPDSYFCYDASRALSTTVTSFVITKKCPLYDTSIYAAYCSMVRTSVAHLHHLLSLFGCLSRVYIYCFPSPDSCQIHSKSILIFIWCWNNNRPSFLLSLIIFFCLILLWWSRGWCCEPSGRSQKQWLFVLYWYVDNLSYQSIVSYLSLSINLKYFS